MGTRGRTITIDFLGNTRDLNAAMDSSSRRTSKLGGALRAVGKSAAIGLAAGGVAAAVGLAKLTKGAIEDEAAQKRLAKTLENSAGATKEQIGQVESWISSIGRARGITDDEMRPALGRLVTATGDVGEASRLMSLAMDVSAGTGKSLEQVTTALAKAQNGSVAGLGRLGVATKDAKGETMTFEQVQDSLRKKFAGQSKAAAETLSGKMARLKVIMSEAGEEIGYKLIPVVTKMADWFLKKGLPAITAMGSYLKTNLGPVFTRIGEVIGKVFSSSGSGGEMSKNLQMIKETVVDFVSIVRSLWNTFGATITDTARKYFGNLKQIIGGQLKIISGVFKVFSSLLKGDWKGVWEGLKRIASGAMDVLKGTLKNALLAIKNIFKIGWLALRGIVSGAWDGIKSAAVRGALALNEKIQEKLDNLVTKFKGLKDRIVTALTNLGPSLVLAGQAIVNSIISGIGGMGSSIASAIKDLVKDAVKDIDVKDFIPGLRQAVSVQGSDFSDGFKSFGASAFGADFTNPETGADETSIDKILAFQADQKAKALQLEADSVKLKKLGLSKDIIDQLASSGDAGRATISALASGTREQIAQYNADNAATNASNTAAGRILGSVGGGGKSDPMVAAINSLVQELRNPRELVGRLKGSDIEISLRKQERLTGRSILAGAR